MILIIIILIFLCYIWGNIVYILSNETIFIVLLDIKTIFIILSLFLLYVIFAQYFQFIQKAKVGTFI